MLMPLDLDIDLDAFMLGSFLVKTKALVAMPDARPELPLTPPMDTLPPSDMPPDILWDMPPDMPPDIPPPDEADMEEDDLEEE